MKKPIFVASVITLASALALSGCATVQHSEPTTTSAPAALPASFPSRGVPLVEGRIQVARGDATDGWSVTVVPTEATLSDAEKQLTAAGYRVINSGNQSATLADAHYVVFVRTPGKAITYQITTAGS